MRRVSRALEAAWRSGLVPPPRLDCESLEAAALRGLPKEAFGPDDFWREPLRILTESLDREADLNALGRTMAHGQIVMALKARIRASSLWRAKPGILQTPLQPPIIILGQMRSGTTRLQRLLACDHRLTHTRLFESLMPIPRPRRRIQARGLLYFLRYLNPDLYKIHPTAVNAPEEEFGLFSFSMGSAQFEAQWRVPAFSLYWEQASTEALYAEFRRLIQTIAWSRTPRKDARWVIKAPQFMQDVPTVLKTFPGANLLWLKRDPTAVIASSASLVWNQMRIQSDSVDPHWVGEEWLRKTLHRQRIANRTLSGEPPAPFLEIGYEAMDRDWRGEMQRIYDHLGLVLEPTILKRMEGYLNNNRAHHGHSYALAQFGLSEGQLFPNLHAGQNGSQLAAPSGISD